MEEKNKAAENKESLEINIGEIKKHLPNIPKDANKYSRGRLLLIAGSHGMAGACIMAAQAALRSGVGYLDVALPVDIYSVVATAVPEAVYHIYDFEQPEKLKKTLRQLLSQADACAMGCGLGMNRNQLCPLVLEYCEKPLLMDADALNWLAEQGCLHTMSQDVVLTPHGGELSRLLGKTAEELEEDRMYWAESGAKRYDATLLFKGPGTIIARTGSPSYKNPTGNAGMARAGSGDVLTGIIGALMAQGMEGFFAATSGAWIHGRAGDMVGESLGLRSMLPTDLISMLSKVFHTIQEYPED